MPRVPRILGRSIRTLLPLAALCAGTGFVPTPARAVDYDFTNLGTAAVSWNDGANWTTLPVDDANFPNAIGDFANVSGDFTANTTLNLNTGITIGRLDVGDSTGTQTMTIATGTGTNTLTFDVASGNATLNNLGGGSGLTTISSGIALNDNLDIVKSATRGLTITGAINLNSNVLSLTGNGPIAASLITLGGIVSGAGSVVVNTTGAAGGNGPSTTFNGANTYTGGTTITQGVAIPGVASVGTANNVISGGFGRGTVTINGGTIRGSATTDRTLFNAVVVGGNFALGEGTMNVWGAVNFAGDFTLSGGSRTVTVSQGTGSTTGTLNTISGVIGDGGNNFGFTKAGAASLVLSGVNTYTGATAVNQGNLILAGNAPVGAAGTLGNASSAVMLGTGANTAGLLAGAAVTVARDITNGGTGVLTLGGNSNHSSNFTGTITLDQNFILTSAAVGGNVTKFNGPINITSGSRTLTKAGAGTVDLAGTSAHTNTAISAGTLRFSNAGAFGSGTLSFTNTTGAIAAGVELGTAGLDLTKSFTIAAGSTGATLVSGANATGTTVTYSGTITLAKGVVLANSTAGATTLISGAITDAASSFGVTINGPGIVEFGGAGVNSYDGGTNVASGTLRLNRNFGGNDTLTGPLTISGGTLQLAGANQLPDSTVLTMNGGTFDAAGFAENITDITYSNGAIINAGLLTVTGSQDLFLFDGTSVAAPTTVNRNLLYLGSSSPATVTATVALDNDASHDLGVNDGAAAVDLLFGTGSALNNETTATSVIKKGAGTVKFTTANGFGGTGQTLELQGGAVEVTADNQLGNAANTVTLNGGALRFASAFSTTRTFVAGAAAGALEILSGIVQTLAGSGQFSGSGTFNKTGAGELIVTGDNSASFSGSASVNAGTLTLSALNNVLGNANSDLTLNGGTLKIAGGFALDAGKTITVAAGGGTFQVEPDQTLDLAQAGNLAGAGALAKTGAGTLLIQAANVGIAAGSTLNLQAGSVQLRDAAALGMASKTAITLAGGSLALVNDTATAFNNPVVVNATSAITAERATVGAGVVHTLGTLSIGSQTLAANVGANQTGTTGGVTFGATTLTGTAIFQPGANSTLTLGAMTAAAGNGFTKTGPGTLIAGTAVTTVDAAAAFAVNEGLFRMNSITALGNSGATITLNGGTLGMGSTAYVSNPLVLAGGTLASIGADRVWNGRADSAPSITFTADTVFNLSDPTAPLTDRSIDLGVADSGRPTSPGPVNLTVHANATNASGFANKRLRFTYRDTAGGTNFNGSVTGTLTVNNAAVAQIYSFSGLDGTTTNSLGSGVELRLNTGINTTTTANSGRLEFSANENNAFGNHVVLLGDSTIGLVANSGGTGKTLSINNLEIGNHTLLFVDVNSSSFHSLSVAGTTTLTGNATFFNNATPLILANVTDGAGSFGLTKSGTGSLTFAGTTAFDGPLTVTAGTVAGTGPLTFSSVLGSVTTGTATISAALAGSAGLTKSGAGTLALTGVNSYTGLTSVTAGTLTANVAGAIPGNVSVTGGILTQGVANALTAANHISVDSALLNFAGRNATVNNVTLTGLGNVNALGLVTGTNATTLTEVQIAGTLTINADPGSAGTSVTINSGLMGSSVSANKVVIQSGTTAGNSGAIFVGGNTPGSSLTIGAGGLELSNIASGSYNAIFVSSSGGAPKLNLGGDVTFTGNANPNPVSITGTNSAIGGQFDLGAAARTFQIGDGASEVDVFVGLKTVGAGGLIKTGAGTLELGNPGSEHTYTGATDVNAGRLLVSGTLNGTTGVNVAAAATLGGTGTINASVTVAGTLAPGASPGTLEVNSLNLGATSTLSLELEGIFAGDFPGAYDQLNTTALAPGAISLTSGAQISLSLSGFTPTGSEIFYVLTRADSDAFTTLFAGTTEGGVVNIGGGFIGQITYRANWTGDDFSSTPNGGNDVAIYNVIPEPSSLVILFGGLGTLVGLRRRSPRR